MMLNECICWECYYALPSMPWCGNRDSKNAGTAGWPRTHCVDFDCRGRSRFNPGAAGLVVTCERCRHCKPVADGSGVWCELWRHRTRLDGYCHMGEGKVQ